MQLFGQWNCVLSVQIGIFSGSYFPAFGLNTKIYSVNRHILSKFGKIRTRKNCDFGHLSGRVMFTETIRDLIFLLPCSSFSLFWYISHISYENNFRHNLISFWFCRFWLYMIFFSLDCNNDCCFDTNDWLLCWLRSNTSPVKTMVSIPDALYDFISCGSLDWWCNAASVSACEYRWN